MEVLDLRVRLGEVRPEVCRRVLRDEELPGPDREPEPEPEPEDPEPNDQGQGSRPHLTPPRP